eukprot:CAMPEP_0113501298 /NCGR_PEP_ID=MMETSP0014_2-20120614/32870_1 /TAXON_ID=2857 /ORGANISM="Nitzschia sp." /LENGTH=859 /DNA_ID=CAMNT_0000395857 /DNA_START=70 /DNA_END=2645 /DNA_ORIENTATION=- /assembly_acc=CAM_ASM_000159
MEDLVELLDRPEQQILTLLTTSSSSSSSSSKLSGGSKLSGSKLSGSKSNSSSEVVADETRSQLIQYAQSLFRDIESLGTHYHALGTKKKNKPKNDDDGDDNNDANDETQIIRPGVLSGLAEMYVPASNDDTMIDDSDDDDDEENNNNNHIDDDNNNDNVNSDMIETIFGQVELQNDALKRLMKSSIKKLSSTAAASSSEEEEEPRSGNNGKKNMIRVLDMDQMNDEREEESQDEDEDDDEDVVSDQDQDDDDKEEEDDDDEDEDARRIRERMERAMEDMEDMNDDEDIEDEAVKEKKKKKKKNDESSEDDDDDDDESEEKEEDLYDPVVEDLKDGFFDLNEMEAFADEEEEFLPDEAFGQPQDQEGEDGDDDDDDEGKKKKKKETKSFHQRQRDGDLNDESGDDEDDGDDDAAMDDMYEEVKPVRRKKYRDQEDIDALYNLYQDPTSTGMELDDGDNEVDVDGITASDYFGGPKKKYIERYRKNHPPESSQNDSANQRTGTKNAGGGGGDDDDDSWGEYDFEQEDQAGWQDQDSDEDGFDNDQDEDEDGDEDDEDDEDDEHDEPMNDEDSRNKQGQRNSNDGVGKKNERKLSKHEAKLQRQTEDFEKELLSEKPWQMRGETKSTSRPVNSLLESTPEFEMASKQAPTITVQHTASLEDIIKRRILAEDWDDVVSRELPDVGWHKKRGEAPEVSQEKSKLGLGELYEREYLKKAVGYDVDAVEKQTGEDKAKDEMKQLFANICSKLDALSNYHFAPRPVADEAEVRTVTQPAIAMEEVLPLHVSDARGVAPEEVFATKRGRDGILRSETEMDQSERKRQRQSKKAARRKARKEKLADEKLISRLQPGLGLNNPYEKRKAR